MNVWCPSTSARTTSSRRSAWAAVLGMGLAGLSGSTARADGPAPTTDLLPRAHFPAGPESLVLSGSPATGTRIPFLPRAPVVLYTQTTQNGFRFNPGPGGNPDGSGVQQDVWFDDVPIPQARLGGTGINDVPSLVDVYRVRIGVRRLTGAGATDVKLYWSPADVAGQNIPLPIPASAGTQTLAANAGASVTTEVTFGSLTSATPLFTVPLNFELVGNNFGLFLIGVQFSNPDTNLGWRGCTGAPDANLLQTFWVYDSDVPLADQTGRFTFGVPSATVPQSTFYAIVEGMPVVPSAPKPCCVPDAAGTFCFVARDAAHCTLHAGTVIAGSTTCSATACNSITCCNNTTGVCNTIFAAACPAGQDIQPTGTLCSANPCTQPVAPANDDCAVVIPGSAFELAVGNGTIPATRTNQVMVGATASMTTTPGCTVATNDVWYLLTLTAAQSTAQFQINVTPQAASGLFEPQPAALAVYDGFCPTAGGGELACVDINANPSATFTATGSMAYFIRVAAFNPTTMKFNIAVTQVTTVACCNPTNGLCVASTSAVGCTTQAGYTVNQGPGTTCASAPCPRGSCCGTGGVCTLTGPDGCTPANFTLSGTCVPNNCSGACCHATTFACTIGSAADCTASSGSFAGGGTLCTTQSICPGPANDQCTAATALTLGTAVNGTVNSASGTDITSCSGSTIDVWYTFTPATTGNYSIKTTPASATDVGTGLAIFTGACDPVADTDIDCVPQAAVGGTNELLDTLIAGTPILIRVGAFAGDTGNYSILVSQPAGLGACCDIGAVCVIVAAATDCAAPAVYKGVNTTCAAPATQCPAGSCCFPRSGQCFVTIQSFCTGVTGVWNAGDQACATTNCVAQTPPNDDCTTAKVCTSPTFTDNTGTDGAANEGAPISACNDQTATGAQNSVWYTFTAPTAGIFNIKATNYGTYDMIMGVFTGACGALTELGCVDDPEPYDVNINMPAGSNVKFMIAQFGLNPGGGWLTVNTTFALSGQCCINGACTVTTQAACTGTWTSGGTCTVNTCPVASGLCCRGATCNATVTQANCTSTGSLAGSVYQTASATCTPNTLTGCCFADYNKVNGIEVQDIFDFINDWLAGSRFANTNGDGNVAPLAVQNIFDFINDWLAGCH